MAQDDRLHRLALHIEALAQKDERLLQKTREVAALRRQAACALHSVCSGFVASLNGLLSRPIVEIVPPEYNAEMFQEAGANLIQINAQGRLVQIAFQATSDLYSTEAFKLPYTLQGEIRTYNQEMLDRVEIDEQRLFFCVQKEGSGWRYFDPRKYRTGLFDQEFLVSLMERVV
jgi:hypothetical protein